MLRHIDFTNYGILTLTNHFFNWCIFAGKGTMNYDSESLQCSTGGIIAAATVANQRSKKLGICRPSKAFQPTYAKRAFKLDTVNIFHESDDIILLLKYSLLSYPCSSL